MRSLDGSGGGSCPTALPIDSGGRPVVAGAVPVVYAAVLLGASAAIGLRSRRLEALLVPAVAAIMHLAWGAGFLAGLACAALSRRTLPPRPGGEPS